MKTRSYAVMAYLANHPGLTAYQISRGISGADPLEVLDILFEAESENFVKCERQLSELAFLWWVKFDPEPVRVSGKDHDGRGVRSSSGSDTTEHD